MEIILKEDVIGLGYKNDIVNVKGGYGRNFLIPKGIGIEATANAKKILAENLRQQAQKIAKIKADAEAKAQKLSALSLVIPAKVSRKGVIYGSVNSLQIADELKKLGFDVDRKLISVKDAKDVKVVGHYIAIVKLHKEVSAEFPFEVIADGSAPEEEEQVVETPIEEVSVEEIPVEETPVEEAPVEETPTEETPAAE